MNADEANQEPPAIEARRVLLVDDHPLNAEIARDMLTHLGFDADVASGGQEAIDLFDPKVHGAVLMDLQMPGMDGLEATKQIRARTGSRVPIIAITANVATTVRQACLQAGMDDFLGKPFGPAQLRDTLEKWLAPTRTSRLAAKMLLLLLGFLTPWGGGHLLGQGVDGIDLLQPAGVEGYRWRTAGGNYLDPASFFSLHGYVDGVFAGRSADWTVRDPAAPGMPGQVLIPNTANSSFQYDAALFVGSEPSPRTRLMMEWHLVSDPGGRGAAGPGGLTMVMTEATASWELVPSYLTLSGGLFWAPFATVNQDWLGAQNLFTLVPIASGIFPAHLNERGVRLDGAYAFDAATAVNYVVSVGNGTQNFDISGQKSFDENDNKTVVARVGVFPGLSQRLEIGLSAAAGQLRPEADLELPVDDPARYAADFDAWAVDAMVLAGALHVRGYHGRSREELSEAASLGSNDLNRGGTLLEAGYALGATLPFGITQVVPKARADFARQDVLDADGLPASFKSVTYSIGATLSPHRQTQLSLEYHFRRERDRTPLANDRFVVRFSSEF